MIEALKDQQFAVDKLSDNFDVRRRQIKKSISVLAKIDNQLNEIKTKKPVVDCKEYLDNLGQEVRKIEESLNVGSVKLNLPTLEDLDMTPIDNPDTNKTPFNEPIE
jgi:hypothetical protein